MPIKYGDIAKAPKGALHSSVALCLQRDTYIHILFWPKISDQKVCVVVWSKMNESNAAAAAAASFKWTDTAAKSVIGPRRAMH